jgi:ubiquitin-protein ligase
MEELARNCSNIRIGGEWKPRFEFTHNGKIADEEYPDTYGVTLRVKGMELLQPFKERYEHQFTVYLPATYPAQAPIIKWHTPIFHPNILMFDEGNEYYLELREKMGGEELLTEDINKDPRWLNVLDGYVCLNTLREDWTPSISLDMLIVEIANMVRYQTFSTPSDESFNKAAAQWAREKQAELPNYFPIDKEGLTKLKQIGQVRVIGVEKDTGT